jgi:hypothetical protein
MSARITVAVDAFSSNNGVTEYLIKVMTPVRQYEIQRQYGEFMELYHELMYKFPAVGKFRMPSRNLFCCEMSSLKQKRRETFHEFCKVLISVHTSALAKEIIRFFELTEDDLGASQGGEGNVGAVSVADIEVLRAELDDEVGIDKAEFLYDNEIGVDKADYLDEVGVDEEDFLPEVGVDADDYLVEEVGAGMDETDNFTHHEERLEHRLDEQSYIIKDGDITGSMERTMQSEAIDDEDVIVGDGFDHALDDDDEEDEYEFLERALGADDDEGEEEGEAEEEGEVEVEAEGSS